MTKYQKGGLSNRHLFFHSSGSWDSEIKIPAGIASGEISFLAVSSCGLSSVYIRGERVVWHLFLSV